MNLAVESPTKVIRLDATTYRTGARGCPGAPQESCNGRRGCAVIGSMKGSAAARKEGVKGPADGKAQKAYGVSSLAGKNARKSQKGLADCRASFGSIDIDFYEMMSSEEGCGADPKQLKTEAPAVSCVKKCLTPTSMLCEKPPVSQKDGSAGLDFFIVGLKNDMRVRTFHLVEKQILIHFWTVSDAITFYRQYFHLARMHFAPSADSWSIFSAHEPSGELLVTPTCGLLSLASTGVDLCASDGTAGFFQAPESDEEEFLERQMVLDNVSSVLCKITQEGSLSSTPAQGSAPEKETDCASDDHQQFLMRVSYFDRMKNFFSKNDVRKMEALYAEGRHGFLYLNSKEISCGCFSNVIMQNAVKTIGDDRLCEIITNLGYDIVPISATKHGAYTVQTILLSAATARSQGLLSRYFSSQGAFLIDHAIGNYAIQKILRFDDELVYGLCMANLSAIVASPLGFKVLKRCLVFFRGRSSGVLSALHRIEDAENTEQCKAIIQILNDN